MLERSLVVLVVGVALASVQPQIARAGDDCTYHGDRYSDGSLSCQEGKRFKCDDGEWKSKDERCTADKAETHTHEVIKKKTEKETEESD